MIRVALRGLLGRKLRVLLTGLAIVLGVAMVSGTFVLTDTIDKAFNTLFEESYAGTDVVVTGRQVFETDFSLPPSFSEELLDDVRAVDDVEAAAGGIQDFAQLVGKDGEAISTGGAPALGFGIDFSEPRFNPLDLETGEWPDAAGEVALDAGTADREGFEVGDRIGVRGAGAVQEFTVVGTATFGSVDSIGGTTAAYFDIPTAQVLFDKEGELDGIQVAAVEGVSSDELIAELEPLLPPRTQALSGEQQAAEDSSDVEEFTSFIQYFLLAFGGIALFVGAFVIFNTLSITVAQRTREFATLRTIGASRRQVLWSVVIEAFVIGLLASLTGLFAGLGLAVGLNEVFVAFGIDLPSSGTVFATRTVIVSLVLGVVVTLVAGIFPAIRATRVPPIAAVREGAVLPRSRFAPLAPYIALFTIGLGIAALVFGMFKEGLGTVNVLLLLGVGVLVLFIGISLVSARLVGPLASTLGWPGARFGGAAGKLARDNSMRNPGRTASTAAALMIGLALITFVAVLARGLTQSVGAAIDDQLATDYVVTSENGFTPFEPGVDEGLAATPGAEVVPVRGEFGHIDGRETQVTGIDPTTISSVYLFEWDDGSDERLLTMGSDAAVVESEFAKEEGLAVGDSFRITAPSGETLDVTVAAIYSAPSFWQMLGEVSVTTEAFDATFEAPRNLYTFVFSGGVSDASTDSLEGVVADYPGVELFTQEGFKQQNEDQVSTFLNLLFVLLALSVIVSLFGMVNTLVLSVFERTRELGMLRAVGMTRRQARRMVRHESVITALIGAALGMPLGIALAALVTTKLSSEGLGFAVPWGQLVIFAIVAIAAGIVAAVFPARRAARLNVLEALQYE